MTPNTTPTRSLPSVSPLEVAEFFGVGRAKGFDLDKRCLHTVSRMVQWNAFPIPNRRTV